MIVLINVASYKSQEENVMKLTKNKQKHDPSAEIAKSGLRRWPRMFCKNIREVVLARPKRQFH